MDLLITINNVIKILNLHKLISKNNFGKNPNNGGKPAKDIILTNATPI